MVDTPEGLFIRNVPSASPLPEGVDAGFGAEVATGLAAARFGMPDFVFVAPPLRIGSGVREPGDSLMIVGDVGLSIQVKLRDRDAIGDEDGERRWVMKKIRKAIKQADGTVRLLTQTPGLQLANARGRLLNLDEIGPIRWYSIVVIDHPLIPDGIVPNLTTAKNPALVLVRRDWDFLFAQLKSATAVVGYFNRVTQIDGIPLGEESSRYYELAQADADTPPGPTDPRLFGGKGALVSAPLLPFAPADLNRAPLLRMILEDVAVHGISQSADEPSRLRLLARLDRLPVGHRDDLDAFLRDAFGLILQARDSEIAWRFRQFAGGNDSDLLLAFGACSVWNDYTDAAYRAWVSLRHHQMQEATNNPDLVTVAALLTPTKNPNRPFDTVVVSAEGDLGFSQEEYDDFYEVWGDAGEEIVK
jgi:hypothetical protein